MKIGYYISDSFHTPGLGFTRENPSALFRRIRGEGKLSLYKFRGRWIEDYYNLAPYFYENQDLVQVTDEEAGAIIERWTGEPAEKYLRDLPWEPGEEGVEIATTYMF